MTVRRVLSTLLAVALAPLAVATPSSHGASEAGRAAPSNPLLVAVRARHVGDVDRVVFEFRGGLPADRQVEFVDRLFADGSGRRVHVAGQALLRVRFERAQAHTDAGAPTAARAGWRSRCPTC